MPSVYGSIYSDIYGDVYVPPAPPSPATSFNELIDTKALGYYGLQEQVNGVITDSSGSDLHGLTDVLNTRPGPNSYLSSAFDFSPDVTQVARLPRQAFVSGVGAREYAMWVHVDSITGMQAILDAGGFNVVGGGFKFLIDNIGGGRYRLIREGTSGRTGLDPVIGAWTCLFVTYPGDGLVTSIRMHSDSGEIVTTAGNNNSLINTVFNQPPGDPQARIGNNQDGTQPLRGGMAGLASFPLQLEPSERAEFIAGPEPLPLTNPSITGQAVVGETLSVQQAAWDNRNNGLLVRQWQWQRWDGITLQDIPGATGPNYTLTVDDVGWQVRVRELGGNDGGVDERQWAASGFVEVGLPPMVIDAIGHYQGGKVRGSYQGSVVQSSYQGEAVTHGVR